MNQLTDAQARQLAMKSFPGAEPPDPWGCFVADGRITPNALTAARSRLCTPTSELSCQLARYVVAHGQRGPIEGWPDLPDFPHASALAVVIASNEDLAADAAWSDATRRVLANAIEGVLWSHGIKTAVEFVSDFRAIAVSVDGYDVRPEDARLEAVR